MNEFYIDRIREEVAARMREPNAAHDLLHVLRVAKNAQRIAEAEGGDGAVVIPAALLHELFNHPKDHPESHLSGEICAGHARSLLREIEYPGPLIEPICTCIREHPWSLGIRPETLEGRILQDADRLDAIGAVGLARLFATAGTMKVSLYQIDDPLCRERDPDDKRWALDHIFHKLLRIPGSLHTATARRMAEGRTRVIEDFLDRLCEEIDFIDREAPGAPPGSGPGPREPSPGPR